jgi:hypothetical protein
MKTMLPLLSSLLLALASTQLVRADAIPDAGQYYVTIYDVGQYQIVGNTIAATAQVLGTHGGNGGPILTFVTGSLQSGTIGNGVFAAGGYFDLNDYHCAGCARNPRRLFTGYFSAPTDITTAQGVELLTGAVAGTLKTGRYISGTTTQYLSGSGISGSTSFPGYKGGGLTSPEPTTLSLFGAGLVAIVGSLRRRTLGRN